MKYKIGESIDFLIYRQEANFDRACDAAYQMALMRFGVDEDGHSDRVEGWERTHCAINVKFLSYQRQDHDHLYGFACWVSGGDND